MDEAYVALVRRLADTRDPEIISNSSIEHAAVLIGEMFRSGAGQAQIFSGSLNPALYAREDIITCMGSFLANTNSSLRILLQEESEGKGNAKIFLDQVKERLGESALSRIEIKQADEFAKAQTYHFATVGQSSFRFEGDRTKHEAFASFGQSAHVNKINGVFDSFWKNAIDINTATETATSH